MSRQGAQIALSLAVGEVGPPPLPSPSFVRPLPVSTRTSFAGTTTFGRSLPSMWLDRLTASGQETSVYQALGGPLAMRGDAGTIFAYPLSICGSIIGKGSFH